MKVDSAIKVNTFRIAQGNAPIDTGNLRFNAMKLSKVKDSSWSITYSLDDAYYIEILEEGTLNGTDTTRKATKFIEKTSKLLASYLENIFNCKPVSKYTYAKIRSGFQNSQDTTGDTQQRQLRHFESKYKMGNVKWR